MDIERLLGRATDSLSVGRAFGPPVERGDTVLIPVAWVAGGGGAGSGEQPGEGGAEATGNGGGFGGITWPLGVYVVKDGRVRWVPAVDATRIVLAVLAVVRLMVKVTAARSARAAR